MPIDIQNLHIKSTVLQGANDEHDAPATAAPAPDSAREAARLREQLLAECKRMIRDALNERQER